VTVHPCGWQDPSSTEFHGKDLARRGWALGTCQSCHGQALDGGTAGVSCLSCHQAGAAGCASCHASLPGAHPTHLAKQVDCSECHVKPSTWVQPGHLDGGGAVVLGARANLTIDAADRAGPASWNGTTCSNVYCHGAALHAPGGATAAPRWDDPTPAGGCTFCHGAPPPSHARVDCATCHPPSAPHIDGVIEVGRTTGCDGCHGGATSPAPPTDLAGNTATTALGVGAHQAHLRSTFLRGPVPCETCHAVPQAVTSPGHLVAGPAAVTLAWDRDAQTCGTWCHGGTSPRWTSTGTVFCGSCHGIPPADASHTPAMTLQTCATCHPATVDAYGSIIVTSGASHHMDGVIDAN
jgi:predicted CxxxxCH...CXXCH cytochrome family protein